MSVDALIASIEDNQAKRKPFVDRILELSKTNAEFDFSPDEWAQYDALETENRRLWASMDALLLGDYQ